MKTTLKTYFLAFIPSVLWAVVIYLFSAQEVLPSFNISLYDFLLKKSGHMFVYAVLYVLLYQGFKKIKVDHTKTWLYAFLLCLIYAVSDELHQSFVPGRYATLRDIGYDLLGASLVLLKKFKYI